ncbi:hypothetical protein [Streptomyces sp. NPDC046985]|uniref:hypothetical protein n=1 Tax=Streptomyces sp. NPDC046985 TaxID=3155377 RepID=UPI0033E5383F
MDAVVDRADKGRVSAVAMSVSSPPHTTRSPTPQRATFVGEQVVGRSGRHGDCLAQGGSYGTALGRLGLPALGVGGVGVCTRWPGERPTPAGPYNGNSAFVECIFA